MNALPAFEAAARLTSFSAAAKELNVTQSAVSRQIRLLEEDLQTRLFIREKRSIRLTARGRELHQVAAGALDMLARTCREFRRGVAPTKLRVSADLSFGHQWLVNILSGFNAAYPEIGASMIASDYEPDCLREDVEVAILFGSGDWPGFRSRFLFGEEVFPVCSPGYRDANPPIALDTLLDHTLLDLQGRWDWMSWRQWLGEHGMPVPSGFQFQDSNNWPLLIESARQGRGIALGWRYFVDPMLADGSLVRPCQESVSTSRGYYLLTRTGPALSAAAEAFCDWTLRDLALVIEG